MEAEREAVKVMQVEFLKRHVGDDFGGVISGVTRYGIFVELSDLLAEGMIHVLTRAGALLDHGGSVADLNGLGAERTVVVPATLTDQDI